MTRTKVRAKPARVRTITRRKTWPSWARWFAIDECGSRYVYEKRPEIGNFNDWYPVRGDWNSVRGPRLDADWTKTLRRIVPRTPPKRKGKRCCR